MSWFHWLCCSFSFHTQNGRLVATNKNVAVLPCVLCVWSVCNINEDVPKLGKESRWNCFEVSNEYYEMCAAATASNSTFSVTLGESSRQLKKKESGAHYSHCMV